MARAADRGSPENAAAVDRSGCYDFFLSGRIQSSHGAAAAMNSPGIATPATRPTIERKTSEISIMQRSSKSAMCSLYLEDHLDLDRNVHRQPAHAHRRARVLADGFAEDLDHQIGEAVDHLGLVAETVRGVHHAQRLDDPTDLVEAAEVRPDRREEREPDLARDLIALLHREVLADLALRSRFAVTNRAVAGDEEQIAGSHGAHVIRHRAGRLRKRDVLFLESCFRAHRDSSSRRE